MIRVELTEREARAIVNSVEIARMAFDTAIGPTANTNLATAHGKLIAAIEQQEATAR
jgi:hypothetical protein